MEFHETDPHEAQIARDTLERYSGSEVSRFGSYVLLTNFSRYIRMFAEIYQVPLMEGSMFTAAHAPDLDISIIDFKLGAAAAALIVDLVSFLPTVKGALMLGMCGGLRRHYKVGDYFVPIASIRGEGASDFYFPPEVPALANFLIQKAATEIFDRENIPYHIGITHTTNIRFWEFNEAFKEKLKENKAQSIEMECATLFSASYRRKLPLGALLLISDLPLKKGGIKTKKSARAVFDTYSSDHLAKGVETLLSMKDKLKHKAKGAFRGKSAETDI
ncbi:MAG: AMP nucleosidase [Chlamydiae bacterium]|nr:AMP nucleosidase [Chlamydiota bacterium]